MNPSGPGETPKEQAVSPPIRGGFGSGYRSISCDRGTRITASLDPPKEKSTVIVEAFGEFAAEQGIIDIIRSGL